MAASIKNLASFGVSKASQDPSQSQSLRGPGAGRRLNAADPEQTARYGRPTATRVRGHPNREVTIGAQFRAQELLSLNNRFFQWSACIFQEPQMQPSEADGPGSRLDWQATMATQPGTTK